MSDTIVGAFNRRDFVRASMSAAALAALPASMLAAAEAEADKAAVLAQIPKMHAENIRRLQEWIALPSIAAENRNYPQGPEYMAQLARAAGFTGVKLVPTSGKPGVFGRLDAGAPTTVGIYFMYDVKQFVPEEWSSPPLEGRLVQKAGLGTVCMGRGAVNQKGPENSFLSALMAFKSASRKLPVNLVLVCEGEEEIASPHFSQIVMDPQVLAELKKCNGVWMPEAAQDRDGGVQVNLGAKGVVELELVSSGEKWGRGPKHDIHSSLEAAVDSPSWHLVQALNTLVEKDGHTPAVEGFYDKVRPLTAQQKKMIEDYAAKLKAHLAKHGFSDVEVNMSGGYDPTQTDPDSRLIQTQLATYRHLGAEPLLWPRLGGSWPGCVFTGPPLSLPAGHFGMGHGTGAHAPDEYYLIESTNPKVQGLDGAVASFVEYLYALA